MATGPEHYQIAEQLINAATNEGGSAKDTAVARACTALAQVHATLAQAAAVAMASTPADGRMNEADYRAWDMVAGVPVENTPCSCDGDGEPGSPLYGEHTMGDHDRV